MVVSVDDQGRYLKDYGNAIMSKYQIKESKVIRLKNLIGRWDFDPYDKNFGDRLALYAKIITNIGEIAVFNIHCDTFVFQNKRKEQLEQFFKDIKDIRSPKA